MFLSIDVTDKFKLTLDYLQEFCKQLAERGLFTFDKHAGFLTFGGVVSALLCMLMMVLLAFLFYKKKKALDFCDRNLTYAFIAVWMLGFVVYDVGMYPDHCTSQDNAFWALLGVAPMAIIHAFEMFILQSDVSAIQDGCHNSAWFMFFFSIAHLLAAFISMVFVIKHFGFNIVASFIKIIKTYFWPQNKENLYVFWGMNDATYYLAKDILNPDRLAQTGVKDQIEKTATAKSNSDFRIMIIRVNNAKEEPNKPIGMDRLFNFLSLSNNNLDNLQELQKMGCLTNSTFGSLTNAQAANNNDLIKTELRLNSLVKLMNHTTGMVHMFFLGDDEAFNLQAVGDLKRDTTIKEFVENKKITFYCHARHNSIQRVIEDEPTHKNIEVRVIDSSHLSVEQLKLEENIHLQPVSYVNIEKDATVSSAFNALVVGFSEVGLDMVRFLYEFGAFVKHKEKDATKKDKEEVDRSDFHCDVVDKDMAALAGLFMASTPSLDPPPQLHLESEYIAKLNDKPKNVSILEMIKQLFKSSTPRPKIELHEMDCQGLIFYKCLEYWLPDLNYVVLATGNDELNMTIAEFIFRQAICHRGHLNQFRIMVRVQHDENGHFNLIAQYYNRLWKAENASSGNRIHQDTVTDSEEVDGPISLFGSTEKIYTYAHIVDETLKEKAKRYKAKYDQSLYKHQLEVYQSIPDDDPQKEKKKPYPILTWDEEQNDYMQLNDDYKGYSPTFSGIMRLRRTQNQNLANSLHAATKVMLAREAFDDNELDNIRRNGLIRNASNEYNWKNSAQDDISHIRVVMDTLAKTEHLRWVASHEMLGYRMSSTKDEARLLHNYICDWAQLSADIRGFDYNTVDVSLTDNSF